MFSQLSLPLLYLHQFSELTRAAASTTIQLLNVCWVPAHRSPRASLCCCINLKQNLQPKTFRAAALSVRLPGRHLRRQRLQTLRERPGFFKQRAPTHSDLFTGRGRFKGKLRKAPTQRSQRGFSYLKPSPLAMPSFNLLELLQS